MSAPDESAPLVSHDDVHAAPRATTPPADQLAHAAAVIVDTTKRVASQLAADVANPDSKLRVNLARGTDAVVRGARSATEAVTDPANIESAKKAGAAAAKEAVRVGGAVKIGVVAGVREGFTQGVAAYRSAGTSPAVASIPLDAEVATPDAPLEPTAPAAPTSGDEPGYPTI
jgi:hypothetical protein